MEVKQLTFTRFVAAIAIVVFHMGMNCIPFKYSSLHDILINAHVFVSFFFILSGFVMILAYSKNNAKHIEYKEYYVKRLARIYPLYLAALLAMFLVSVYANEIWNFLLQAFFLQSWIPGKALTLNSPGWSLSTEIFFYVVFPVLFNKYYKIFKWQSVVVTIILIFIASHAILYWLHYSSFYKGYPSHSHDLIFYFPLSNLPDFLIGNAFGILFLNTPKKFFRNYALVIILTFALIVFLMANNRLTVLPALFVMLILLLSLNKTGYITRIFSLRPMVLLGEVSYGIYILQQPIFVALYHFNRSQHWFSDTLTFYLGLVILIITATGCYFFIERPITRYIKGKMSTGVKPVPVLSLSHL